MDNLPRYNDSEVELRDRVRELQKMVNATRRGVSGSDYAYARNAFVAVQLFAKRIGELLDELNRK